MPPPRIKISCIWLRVLGFWRAVRMEYEFIWRKIHAAVGTLDALGPGAVVSGRDEAASTSPGAFVGHVKGKIFWKFWRRVASQEGLAKSLGFAFSDHSAASGGDWHRSGSPQYLQLDRGALDAGDAQRHTPVVYLVVAVILQQGVGYLRKAKSLLAVYHQRHNRYSVQHYFTDLVGL